MLLLYGGHRLYNNLPKSGYQGHDCAESETWVYQLKDGKEVRLLLVCHPSAAFDPHYWHNVISAFINNAEVNYHVCIIIKCMLTKQS